VVNGVMLWAAHQLLGWGWPDFLTADFDEVLPVLSASLVVGMVVNACFLVSDRGRFRAFGDLITAVLALAVSVRMWDVFPFDFTGYDRDWSWLFRAGIVLAIVGTAIAGLVNAVKLVRGTAGPAG
jgi:hypothetical protein